ncbi:MAG: transposase [Deltaproteobacteria bacterium]|nr:transposase [Deltaproteobacteria bacterium]
MGWRGQLKLIDDKMVSEHGGSLSLGRQKGRRPFSRKKAMHLVLRSELAKGPLSLLQNTNACFVRSCLSKLSRRYEVRVYQFANAGSHLHLVIRAKRRESFQAFLRAFAGTVALKVTKASKSNPFGKFWCYLCYSRLVEWGAAFKTVKAYVFRNELECLGLIPYEARKIRPPPT